MIFIFYCRIPLEIIFEINFVKLGLLFDTNWPLLEKRWKEGREIICVFYKIKKF